MAQQQRPTTTTTTGSSISSFDDQLNDMISELYNTERTTQQTGTFIPMAQASSSIQTFGTNNPSTVSLPTSTIPSPAPRTTSKRNRAITPIPYKDDNKEHVVIVQVPYREKYRCRTLCVSNITRMGLLPIFPYPNIAIQTVPTADNPTEIPISLRGKPAHLLLSNVPSDLLSPDQYARRRHGMFPPSFRLQMIGNTSMNINDSFLLNFYEKFFMELKQRLQVDISILDFNLIRLRQCVDQVVVQYQLEQTMFNMDELAVALEFYLQIDADLFFMKTCSFNGAQPRIIDQEFYEGLFCVDTPIARFSITPCQKPSCLCCHPSDSHQETTIIQFSVPHIHRFVNQYEAILNCPATCESKNCIYVLTCPCGQFDFIGESKVSFAETLAMHREESNRIIREFLIGERNVEYTTRGLKSEKKKANDQLWLYQHSARCFAALQLFLDHNPEYWCFVPLRIVERRVPPGTIRGYLSRQVTSTTHEIPSPSDIDLATSWTRKDADVQLLMANVPKPPTGYAFNDYLRQQQANFFKWAQDRNVPLHDVNVYNADIIAILPDNASKLLRKLIESLLITHADCKLNQIGHLLRSDTTSNINPNLSLDSTWCVRVTQRRPPSS